MRLTIVFIIYDLMEEEIRGATFNIFENDV